jgi:ACS family glucarate transporter-like MFS transporter
MVCGFESRLAHMTNQLEAEHPTRARFTVAAWLCGLSAVLYLDRLCMSQAAAPIQAEFKLTNSEMSYVLMAFTLAYGLFEIPTGRLGDKHGSRNVLTRIVIWWSIFTGLTGACSGLLTLIAVRFLFGAGEAGAYPNAARVIARWFPLIERGRVQGLMIAASQIGAVVAPAATGQLIHHIGWRWAFVAFGFVGIVWAVGFWLWFRDDPAQHPSVNEQELETIRAGGTLTANEHAPIPWRAALTNRGILALCAIMICGAFYTYFFYSWFVKYLQTARGLSNLTAGWFSSFVLAGSALGVLLGGWIADWIPKHCSNAITARRWLGVGCYSAAAAFLVLGIQCDDAYALAAFWGASFCAMHVTLPNWWSVAIPQCGTHVGSLFGLMNGMGVLGALASQGYVGAFADWREKQGFTGRDAWDPMFNLYVVVLMLGGIAWWSYRYRPINEPESRAP